jgi:hypothetical protein
MLGGTTVLDDVLHDRFESGDATSVLSRLGESPLDQLKIAIRQAHQLLEGLLSA